MFRNRLFILLAVLLAAVSCSTARRVSQQTYTPSWKGSSALEIIDAMGNPVRIDEDGRGGSILVYETAPGYDDPRYDILDPEAAPKARQYAHFYLDQEGDCYRVDANRDLPAPPRNTFLDSDDWGWLETLLLISLAIQIFL